MTDTIKQLEKQIQEYAQAYYDGESLVTDSEFDEMLETLNKLKADSDIVNSIGYGYTPGKDKFREHKYQLVGSLQKIKNIADIDKNIQDIVITPKLDGLTAVLYYTDGNFDFALTRGDGIKGKDITDKIKCLKNIPDKIRGFTGAIRGEVIIDNDNWEKLLSCGIEYANQRNAAAGIINSNETHKNTKSLSFIAYNIIALEGVDIDTHVQHSRNGYSHKGIVEYLKSVGFETVPFEGLSINQDMYTKMLNMRDACLQNSYLVDGIVITDDCAVRQGNNLVYTQEAFKFESEEVETSVTGIEYNLSRFGRLKPVLLLRPVKLSGVTVRRCTANNARYIINQHIGKGAKVIITRSNEVIPKIVRVTHVSQHCEQVTQCPSCGSTLVFDGVDAVCNNVDCTEVNLKKAVHFMQTLYSIDGIGDATLEDYFKLYNIGSVKELLEKYEGIHISVKSKTDILVNNMFESLRSKPISAIMFLQALSIPGLGKVNANSFANRKFFEDLESGKLTLDSAVAIEIDRQKDFILSCYHKLKDRIAFVDSTARVKVAITGSLSMKRKDFEQLLNDRGYEVTGAIKQCMYLITNTPDSGSAKNREADKYDVQKLTEHDFMELLK